MHVCACCVQTYMQAQGHGFQQSSSLGKDAAALGIWAQGEVALSCLHPTSLATMTPLVLLRLLSLLLALRMTILTASMVSFLSLCALFPPHPWIQSCPEASSPAQKPSLEPHVLTACPVGLFEFFSPPKQAPPHTHVSCTSSATRPEGFLLRDISPGSDLLSTPLPLPPPRPLHFPGCC